MCNPTAVKQDSVATDEKVVNASSASLKANVLTQGDDTPMLDFRNSTEWMSFFAGCILLLLVGPPVGMVVFASMIWEGIDRKFEGGFVEDRKSVV